MGFQLATEPDAQGDIIELFDDPAPTRVGQSPRVGMSIVADDAPEPVELTLTVESAEVLVIALREYVGRARDRHAAGLYRAWKSVQDGGES